MYCTVTLLLASRARNGALSVYFCCTLVGNWYNAVPCPKLTGPVMTKFACLPRDSAYGWYQS